MAKKKVFHHKSFILLESKFFGESNGAILKACSKVDIAKFIKTMRDTIRETLCPSLFLCKLL